MRRSAVILDQEPLWAEALERIVGEAFDVLGHERTGEGALALIERHSPDLLVCELDGLEIISRARTWNRDLKVVVLSHVREPQAIEQALAEGVNVYVFKTSHPDDIVAAVRQAFETTFVLPHAFSGSGVLSVDTAKEAVHQAGLTRREVEMLTYIADGRSNREIARTLWVTEQTVKFHLSNIYRKLGVSNRTEASRWAHLNGVVSPSRESLLTPA